MPNAITGLAFQQMAAVLERFLEITENLTQGAGCLRCPSGGQQRTSASTTDTDGKMEDVEVLSETLNVILELYVLLFWSWSTLTALVNLAKSFLRALCVLPQPISMIL